MNYFLHFSRILWDVYYRFCWTFQFYSCTAPFSRGKNIFLILLANYKFMTLYLRGFWSLIILMDTRLLIIFSVRGATFSLKVEYIKPPPRLYRLKYIKVLIALMHCFGLYFCLLNFGTGNGNFRKNRSYFGIPLSLFCSISLVCVYHRSKRLDYYLLLKSFDYWENKLTF